jgi:hypothetical protein
MQNLFNIMTSLGQGVLKSPEWNYIRAGLQRNLTTVLRHYRRNPSAVKTEHLVVKLIHTIMFPISQELDRFYNNVDAASINVGAALKLTTPTGAGHIFNGTFYGPGNDEIIIGHDEEFDPREAHKNWKNVVPIRVLRHPRSDLGLSILDGTVRSVETGLCVIAINIPLLAVQYRAFRLEEAETRGAEGESELSVMQFVRMYVLPNMLFSHLDLAILNRMTCQQFGYPYGVDPKTHSFFMTDYTSRVDKVQKEILSNLAKYSHDFVGILRSVPAVTKEDMVGVFELPDIVSTRQVLWALVISRLPLIEFLIRATRDSAGTRNQSEINKMLKSITAYKSDSLMRSALPYEHYYDIQETIDEITGKLM